MFSDDFVEIIHNDQFRALEMIVEKFNELHYGDFHSDLEMYAECIIAFNTIIENYNLVYFGSDNYHLDIDTLDKNSIAQHFRYITEKLDDERKRRIIANLSNKYAQFTSVSIYKFQQSDIDKIQDLLNQLRNFVKSTDEISEKHEKRLLDKIEALQSELHCKMTNLDKFYSLIADAAIIKRKIPQKAVTFIMTVKAIIDIVSFVHGVSEGLDGGFTVALPPADKDN